MKELCILGYAKFVALRKQAYSNILKNLPQKKKKKNENSDKNSDISYFCSKHCGYSLEPPRRGGSNEYPQSMFLSRNKTIMYTPVNPSFTISKWGLRGSTLYRPVFVMG